MNENMVKIKVTVEGIKDLAEGLEGLTMELLEKDPKRYALIAESPLEDLTRLQAELEGLLAELRQVPMASAS